MAEKDTILSKLNMKDYRNELELVLENKAFDEEAKGLLLNVFYKIDNFYKDYQSVKDNTSPKSKFLEDYINVIKKECNEIKVSSPQDFKKNSKKNIDKELGSIISFPTENFLLFSIYELIENKNISNCVDFVDKCLLNLLNRGRTVNNTEPIRDFNGWSWSVEINNPDNMTYNLLFQNLLILLGYDFVYNNMNNEHLYDTIRKEIFAKVSRKNCDEILALLCEIAIGLYNNRSSEMHKECYESKQEIQNKIAALKNRREYINYVSKSNGQFIKRIEQIDVILSDVELIKKEFSKSVLGNDGKYFCISDVVDKYEFERKKLISKVEENNNLLKPKKYLEIQDSYKKKLSLYNQIDEDKNKISVQSKIIEFQKMFLDCIKNRINKDESKKDLYKNVSEMRYYNNLPFDKYKRITLEDDVAAKYEEISRMLIYAMINDKIIDLGFKSKDFCYQILKYIFDTKIMKLDSLALKLSFKGQSQLEVEYYDGNILDHQEIFNIPFDEIIASRKARKIKIF